MVIVQLLGRLGNNLFQYALGRALSLQSGAELVLDTRRVPDHQLGQFGISIREATVADLPPARKRWFAYQAWRLLYLNPREVRGHDF